MGEIACSPVLLLCSARYYWYRYRYGILMKALAHPYYACTDAQEGHAAET